MKKCLFLLYKKKKTKKKHNKNNENKKERKKKKHAKKTPLFKTLNMKKKGFKKTSKFVHTISIILLKF